MSDDAATGSTPPALPDVSERMRPFWEGARKGELRIQQCRDCGSRFFPARDLCTSCLGQHLEWVRASGHATLFSYTVMHQVYDPAFADRVPYAVADVRLSEGPRMISNVVDCPTSNLRIGMPLEVMFDAVSEEMHLPRFRPATDTNAGD